MVFESSVRIKVSWWRKLKELMKVREEDGQGTVNTNLTIRFYDFPGSAYHSQAKIASAAQASLSEAWGKCYWGFIKVQQTLLDS
jgi:hypothetical protein